MICYLKILKHQYLNCPLEFNFDPYSRFSFNEHDQTLKYESISFPEKFWESSNLKSINAIVGENGSGKTTIIRDLFNWMRSQKQIPYEKFICILSNQNLLNDKSSSKFTIYYLGFEDIKCDETLFTLAKDPSFGTDKRSIEDKMQLLPIFYSAGFGLEGLKYFDNFNEYGPNGKYFQDVSTENLFRDDYHNYLERKKSIDVDNRVHIDTMQLHFLEDMQRQAEFAFAFVADNKTVGGKTIIDEIKSQIPKIVIIKFNHMAEFKNIDKFIASLEFKTKNFSNFLNDLEKKDDKLQLSILEYLCRFINNFKQYYDSINFNAIVVNFWDSKSSLNTELNDFLEDLGKTDRHDYLKKVVKSLKYFNLFHINNDFTCEFDISKLENRTLIKEYLEHLKIVSLYLQPGSVSWDYPMSSGQYSLVNLFSRLYYAKNQANASGKSIVIFIDEVELYLHPEWQRKTIFWIEHLIAEIMNGMQCQVIIASHSPFILSDLPTKCVSYVGKNCADRYGSFTFAENIHTLFMNTFSLENGLIGESARQKINSFC